MNNRLERVNSQIKRILSNLIANEIKDPRLKGFISISNIDTSKDLSHCKVFISIFGVNEEEKQTTFNVLRNSVPFLRKSLAHSLDTRITPELLLFLHEGMKESDKIEKILNSLNLNKEE